MKILVSIIIVHYHVQEELFACIQSIIESKPKLSYEIIVVDNDEIKTLQKKLHKRFPHVHYIPNENKGFGQGNNVGSRNAKGDYLFFLNPDTLVFKDTIDYLTTYLAKNKKVGIVAPFLLHENRKPFALQGVTELTPLKAIFTLSFIHKLFPHNPISEKYYIKWDTVKNQEVDVVPGTAFMIKNHLYKELNGFDEHFFLYFEEFDFCKRLKSKGYKLYILPKSKIIHLWERSTKQRTDITKIFNKSRFYYLKKHFGLLPAIITEAILQIGKSTVLLFIILFIALVLRLYHLKDLMPFIGDQGWFYLSARDFLLTGHAPLLGITSSHTWLHQGPYWTYLLSGALFLGHFNPISGAYLTVFLGLVTTWFIYKFGSEMFSERIGLLAALFYATSPLIILSDRMPYHTSSIALLTLVLFYFLYKWINGLKYGLPLTVLMLTILYNFETATFMLVPIVVLVVGYGLFMKAKWSKDILNLKLLLLSLLAWIVVMMPMLLYDIHHGYPQTVKFLTWLAYKIATVFGFPHIHGGPMGESFPTMAQFATVQIQQLLFLKSASFSWFMVGLLTASLIAINKRYIQQKNFLQPYLLLFLFFIIPTIGYIVEKTNSSAYLIVFFPTFSYMFAIFLNQLMQIKRFLYPTIGILILFVLFNIYSLMQSNFLVGDGITFTKRVEAAEFIVNNSKGKAYNLIGKGDGSQYLSYTMNYEYLTWWLGHGPSKIKQPLQYVIQEKPTGIVITKQINKSKK